jgi:hypothetical protein
MRELDSGNSEDAEAASKVAAQLSCESIAPDPELRWAYTRNQIDLNSNAETRLAGKIKFRAGLPIRGLDSAQSFRAAARCDVPRC